MLTYESPFRPLWFTKDVFLWLEYWDKSFLLQTMTDTVCTPTLNRDLVQENRRQLSVCKDKLSRSVEKTLVRGGVQVEAMDRSRLLPVQRPHHEALSGTAAPPLKYSHVTWLY